MQHFMMVLINQLIADELKMSSRKHPLNNNHFGINLLHKLKLQ